MFLKNFKNKILAIFLTLLFLPISVFAYSSHVIPGGESVGIQIKSKGIMIVGMYKVGSIYPGKDAGLIVGDTIVGINDIDTRNVNDMVNQIEQDNDKKIKITYLRNNKTFNTNLTLVKHNDNIYKTGLYVKDTITGIGTLTFIDPNTKKYGVLGHEILESNSRKLIEVNSGKLFESSITGIDKSSRGNPGEKNARFYANNILGKVEKNTIYGVFGEYTDPLPSKKAMKVADIDEIELGEAQIRTVVKEDKVEEFTIDIIKLNKDENQLFKNILFEITDEALLDLTGGVVQGMSGSPIIQNDMIIGAVTHVVVDDAAKGYGIYIGYMLEEANN